MIAKAITSQPKTETASVDCLSYDMVQPKPLACHHVEDGLISFIYLGQPRAQLLRFFMQEARSQQNPNTIIGS